MVEPNADGAPPTCGPRSFFPLPRGERRVLGALVAAAAAAYLPPLRAIEIAGVALFGWLMAALMVFSPLLTLWVFWRGRPRA
ncbi:MAG TPA: hypothetical protein VEC18_05900 [Myxococcota bacterium]|nr:hypothetical protein [Myxococcota bacterium]